MKYTPIYYQISIELVFLNSIRFNLKILNARKNKEVAIYFVTEKNIENFLRLQFHEDLHFSESFAKEKQSFLRRYHLNKQVHHIIVYDELQSIKSAIVIEKGITAAIDNLSVKLIPTHRYRQCDPTFYYGSFLY